MVQRLSYPKRVTPAALRSGAGYVPTRVLSVEGSGLTLAGAPSGVVLDLSVVSAGHWSSLVAGNPASPATIFLASGDTVSIWSPS